MERGVVYMKREDKLHIIGSNLKRLRIRADVKVKTVTEELHVNHQSVYKWEKGAALPQADKLVDLMLLYRVYDIRELVKPDEPDWGMYK